MARIAATAISNALRAVERVDGGAGTSTRSTPPVIDLANGRLRLNFMSPARLQPYCNKFPWPTGLHLRHGYRPAKDAAGDPAGASKLGQNPTERRRRSWRSGYRQ